MSRFTSGFSAKLDAYLEYRAARGYKEASHIGYLLKFDKYCAEHCPEQDTLTPEAVHDWLDNAKTTANAFAYNATAIRQLGIYLCAVDETAYVLPDKFAPNQSEFNPYIFTDAELAALFGAVDTLPRFMDEPYLHEIAPVMFRLIYTCGLRPNEGRELLAENIDLKTGNILVTHTKRNKERIIVMSDDMRQYANRYETRRAIIGGVNPYFFPASNGGAFTNEQIYKAFNKAWVRASCSKNNPVHRRVRVYDLRHRFASACLNRWLDNGENLNSMLPYLRTYMGHEKLSETAYYIHILPENLVKTGAINWDVFNSMMPEVDA